MDFGKNLGIVRYVGIILDIPIPAFLVYNGSKTIAKTRYAALVVTGCRAAHYQLPRNKTVGYAYLE
jgi:hypothetical protein